MLSVLSLAEGSKHMEHPCAQGPLFQKLIYLNHLSSLEDYNGVKSAKEMSKEMMGLPTVFPSFIFKKSLNH